MFRNILFLTVATFFLTLAIGPMFHKKVATRTYVKCRICFFLAHAIYFFIFDTLPPLTHVRSHSTSSIIWTLAIYTIFWVMVGEGLPTR